MIMKKINLIQVDKKITMVKLKLLCFKAGWQSGYAAACKAVYAGSIPASASR